MAGLLANSMSLLFYSSRFRAAMGLFCKVFFRRVRLVTFARGFGTLFRIRRLDCSGVVTPAKCILALNDEESAEQIQERYANPEDNGTPNAEGFVERSAYRRAE